MWEFFYGLCYAIIVSKQMRFPRHCKTPKALWQSVHNTTSLRGFLYFPCHCEGFARGNLSIILRHCERLKTSWQSLEIDLLSQDHRVALLLVMTIMRGRSQDCRVALLLVMTRERGTTTKKTGKSQSLFIGRNGCTNYEPNISY